MRKRFYVSIVALLLLSSLAPAATVTGFTPGSLSVSETGAATYTIPIQVPPGTAGMGPKLSLN